MSERRVDRMMGSVMAIGEGTPTLEERVDYTDHLRTSGVPARDVDRVLFNRIIRLGQALGDAKDHTAKLLEKYQALTTPGERVGVIVNHAAASGGRIAVRSGGEHVLLTAGEGVDLSELKVGDEVCINGPGNLILGKVPFPVFRGGDVASFVQWVDSGNRQEIVVELNNSQFVAACSEKLGQTDLKPGDLISLDRGARLARARIDSAGAKSAFLEEVPDVSFEQIGGMNDVIEQMKATLVDVLYPDTIQRFPMPGQKSQIGVLMSGPPGCGKTLLAKAFVDWVKKECGMNAKFLYIAPGSFRHPLYGASEQKIRDTFTHVRSVLAGDPSIVVVMYFDEIDSFGSAREAGSMQRIDSQVSQSLMAELDGFVGNGNDGSRLIIVASTNREFALDPAFIRSGRFGDKPIRISRPGMEAGREIFAKYMDADLPYAGVDRSQLIDAAVSALYCPNADNELCELVLRNGERRKVVSSDLITGADIAKLCRFAVQRAKVRYVETERCELTLEDMLTAVDAEKDRMTGLLTPWNARNHLQDLPDDVDVVKVELLRSDQAKKRRRVTRIREAA